MAQTVLVAQRCGEAAGDLASVNIFDHGSWRRFGHRGGRPEVLAVHDGVAGAELGAAEAPKGRRRAHRTNERPGRVMHGDV